MGNNFSWFVFVFSALLHYFLWVCSEHPRGMYMTQTTDYVVVIMAGGAGKRFWPLSTEENPKQFLTLFDDRSLLRMSYDRIAGLVPPARVLVLTNRDYVAKVAEQLPELPVENIIGEPCRRDTAAASVFAAFICRARYGNPVIATLTADHLIEPTDIFQKTLLSAVRAAAKEDILYTFGVPPTCPATGYGYLERGKLMLDDDGIRHYALSRFEEKPDSEKARQYVASGNYFWNSGRFVWRTETIIDRIYEDLPGHARHLEPLMEHDGAGTWENALEKAFQEIPAISIDYGILERAPSVRRVETAFSWSAAGGWNSLRSYLPVDEAGNVTRGAILTLDAQENLIYCEESDETVMAIGVQDLVIVRAGTKTLIVHRDRIEDIKKLVAEHFNERKE